MAQNLLHTRRDGVWMSDRGNRGPCSTARAALVPLVSVLLALASALSAQAQQNTWVQLSPTPNARWNPPDRYTCPTTPNITSNNVAGRAYSGSAYGNGQIFYWGGGHNSYPANDVELYDIVGNIWKPDTVPPDCVAACCGQTGGYPNCDNDPPACAIGSAGCVAGSCYILGGTGTGKTVRRCSGGTRNQQQCTLDSECPGGGTCSIGVPTPGVPCTTCKSFTEHGYQRQIYNPIRRKFLVYTLSGTWEWDPVSRAWTRLANPPTAAPSQQNQLMLWDPANARPLWFIVGANRGWFTFNYTTNTWTVADSYMPTVLHGTEIYGTYDQAAGKFVISGAPNSGTIKWLLYDPTKTGAAAWTDISASAPTDATRSYCFFQGSTQPCFTSSIVYDGFNQRTIVMTQDAGNTVALWAVNMMVDPPVWQKLTTANAPSGARSTGYPNHLHYDPATQSLFLLNVGSVWTTGVTSFGTSMWRIQLAVGTPGPTNTPTRTQSTATPTLTPTRTQTSSVPPPPPTGSASCTWRVGPSRTHKVPSAVSTLVGDGDTVCIDAATYLGDVARWSNNNLTILGCDQLGNCPSRTRGDWPILDPVDNSISSRGIWWVTGNNFTVNAVEFRCATSIRSNPHCSGFLGDGNDAGIRMQGHGLTVLNCYFHDNDNGILGGADACLGGTNVNVQCATDSECPGSTCGKGNVLIENTEFFRNGEGSGQTHNVYIGRASQATYRYNYSHAAIGGHLLKSRARVNHVYQNRLTDEVPDSPTQDGPSNQLDISSGGIAYVVGNLLQKAHNSYNSAYFLKFGMDPGEPLNADLELYAVNNTFVADCGPDSTCGTGNQGIFIQAQSGSTVWAINNIAWGGPNVGLGRFLSVGGVFVPSPPACPATVCQTNTFMGINPLFVNQAGYDYRLASSSPAINGGVDPGSVHSVGLRPLMEYVYDLQSRARPASGALDLGAFEYEAPGAQPSPPPAPVLL